MKFSARAIYVLCGVMITTIAAVFRIGWLDLAPYQYDEADVLLRVFEMQRGELPLSGAMTSWGVPDPPMMVYLAYLVAGLGQPALAMAGMVAVLNVAAVAITYVAALRHFGFWVAVASGLLFAVNPWAVYFGRRFWTEIIPLFPALAFWAALEVTQRRDARWLPILGAALAMQIQARLLGGLYLPAAALSVLPVAYRWLGPLLLTLAIAVAISAPFIVYVARSFEAITTALREGSRGFTAAANTGLLDLVWWTISGAHLLPFENRGLAHLQPLAAAMSAVEPLVAVALILGAVWTLLAAARRQVGWTRYPILLLWGVTPIALLAGQTSSLYLHYLVVLSPFPFLLMGVVLGWALSGGTLDPAAARRGPLSMALRGAGAAALVAIVVVQSALTLSVYSTLGIYDVRDDERQAPPAQPQAPAALLAASAPKETAQAIGTSEFYGIEIPMRYWLEVRSAAHRLARGLGMAEILVLTEGTDPLTQERPALVEGIIGPELRGRYLEPLSLAIPLGRPSLVLETWALDPAESFQRLGERLETVPLPTSSRTARDATRFYLLPARSEAEWLALVDPPLNHELGGLRLVGARGAERVRSGETVPWVTYWVARPGRLGPDETVSVRLLDERGQRIAARDVNLAASLRSTSEPIGLILRHDISVGSRAPAGFYRVEVSLGPDSAIVRQIEVAGR